MHFICFHEQTLQKNSVEMVYSIKPLWSEPAVPNANAQTQLHQVVHRQGSKNTLSNVTVRFYRGDPNASGVAN